MVEVSERKEKVMGRRTGSEVWNRIAAPHFALSNLNVFDWNG